jgi:tetratricopeptide (TPR) repeat protein
MGTIDKGPEQPPLTPEIADQKLREFKGRNDWAAIAALGKKIPTPLETAWLTCADEVAFAMGQLHRTDEAGSLLEQAYAMVPNHRRASSLAYIYYDAMLLARAPAAQRKQASAANDTPRDFNRDREAFLKWLGVALEHRPDSIKDLYRLGNFEAQIENRRDKPALRCFLRVVEIYRAMPPLERQRQHHLKKPYIKSLYAGARSAYRLARYPDARTLIFDCIREDKDTDYMAPLHKYFLAGRVLREQGQFEHAERAFRLALDGKGPPRRNFVLAAIAELLHGAGRLQDAIAWIEQHIPTHRRQPYEWRLLGDARRDLGDATGAMAAYESALQRDRGGRHLTLVRIADLHRAAGRMGPAKHHYTQALEFRRRKYLSEDRAALTGLLEVARAQNALDAEQEVLARLERLPLARSGVAGPPLDREDEMPPMHLRVVGGEDEGREP